MTGGAASRRARRCGLLLVAGVAGTLAAPAGARADEPALVPAPTLKRAHVAKILVPTVARRAPGRGRVVARVPVQAPWGGGANRLLILESALVAGAGHEPRLWLRVRLPKRPNGAAGWIRADHAIVLSTPWRIHVSLSRRRVTVLKAGRTVRRLRAVVGAPGTPTPTGDFAVYEVVRQPDPDGFLGPWALHLTAFSRVLEDFGGGPGRIGLHGRGGASLRDPLGTARSHGCVRLPNAAIRFLARVAGAGTPVRIRG